jgi:hypothetical protein
VQVGYTTIAADAGNSVPASTALFSYSNSQGILISQAAAGAVVPSRSLVTFVDEEGSHTGIALVNSSSQQAAIVLRLGDPAGAEVTRRNMTLGSGQHMSRYVSELFSGVTAIAVDSKGNLFFTEFFSKTVRAVRSPVR